MTVRTGQLRHCIKIEKPSLSDDGMGGHTESWETFADPVWAKIEPASAAQKFFAQGLEHNVTHKITIRHVDNLESNMRIDFEGRIFHIQSFRNLMEKDKFIEISASEGEAS